MARGQLYPAMLTPMTAGGDAIDVSAVGPEVDFLLGHGADGVFVAGSTGEGFNLTVEERRLLLAAASRALGGRGRLLAHVGAQTTRDTVALAADAAAQGAEGVAVIPPPYYPLDTRELTQHLVAAARAAAPVAFYIYCFAARSGYPVSPEVVQRVGEAASNLAGLKVSDAPWTAIEGYFELGIPVFVGNEPLIADGATKPTFAGSVSALASVYPEATRALIDDPTPDRAAAVGRLRAGLSHGASLVAIGKAVLRSRGVPINADVRPPARTVDEAEGATAAAGVAETLRQATAAVPA